MSLALLVHFHVLNRLLNLSDSELVGLSEHTVLLSELLYVAQIEFLVDHHQGLQIERKEVTQEKAL